MYALTPIIPRPVRWLYKTIHSYTSSRNTPTQRKQGEVANEATEDLVDARTELDGVCLCQPLMLTSV